MVAPAVIAAGVSAVSSLLGGRKAAKEAAKARAFEQQMIREQNAYNAPDAIRARAESAGFNPLLFVGPGVGLQTGLASYGDTSAMGNAIANAGLAVADGINEYGRQQAYESALEKQNADLRKALEKNTIRPKVAGVFGTVQPVTVPDVPANIDRSSISVTSGGLTFGPRLIGDEDQGYAPRGEANDLYPRRVPEVMTIKSMPLVADVELPGGKTIPVLHDGDEIMGFEKLPTFGGAIFVDHFREAGRTIRRKADAAGITDPRKTYTPPVILDALLPERYDPEYWIKRKANRKPWKSGYKLNARRPETGLKEMGF